MVDHYLVYGIRKIGNQRLKNKKPKIIESRNLNKYDKVAFQYDLQQIEWETILSPLANDPNSMAATFQEIFESTLNIHAPLRKKRIRADPAPWITPEIRKLMKKRNKAKKVAINSPDLWQAYKTLRNKVTKAIRDALQSYYLDIIDENKENPKRMWKAVNKVMNRDTNSVGVSSLDIEGRKLTKEKDIAEALRPRLHDAGTAPVRFDTGVESFVF